MQLNDLFPLIESANQAKVLRSLLAVRRDFEMPNHISALTEDLATDDEVLEALAEKSKVTKKAVSQTLVDLRRLAIESCDDDEEDDPDYLPDEDEEFDDDESEDEEPEPEPECREPRLGLLRSIHVAAWMGVGVGLINLVLKLT
jgi:hypothetical protein